MKKIFPLVICSLMVFACFSQESVKTANVVNSLRTINQLTFDDINPEGVSSPQYINYTKLVKNATKTELSSYSQDTNNVVKGFVFLALLEQKQDTVLEFYRQTLINKDYVITKLDGIDTEVYLCDFLRAKAIEMIEFSSNNYQDKKYFEHIYLMMDSIMIMNFNWSESDVTMDYIIEKSQENRSTLSKRKRWIANSYFLYNIAKNDDDYLYGTECGFPAVMPYLRSLVEKSIIDSTINRVDYFDKWISCDILVVKIYGIEALIRLQNEGDELTALHISTINYYKGSYKSLQVCSKYYRERKPVNMILAGFELKGEAEN